MSHKLKRDNFAEQWLSTNAPHTLANISHNVDTANLARIDVGGDVGGFRINFNVGHRSAKLTLISFDLSVVV